MTNIKGDIIECNRAFLDLLGYTEKEIRNITYQQTTPAKWHDMERDIVINKILKTGYSDIYEKEYVKKDGTVFPVSIRVWAIKDVAGNNTGMWGIVRDITERKRAEEALEEERRRLQQALDEVRTLRGIVPICANCKNIRDDKGYWNQVEKYVSDHTEAKFSHGICPDCVEKLYPQLKKQ
jgi:PAS domain S-box-containing protein